MQMFRLLKNSENKYITLADSTNVTHQIQNLVLLLRWIVVLSSAANIDKWCPVWTLDDKDAFTDTEALIHLSTANVFIK